MRQRGGQRRRMSFAMLVATAVACVATACTGADSAPSVEQRPDEAGAGAATTMPSTATTATVLPPTAAPTTVPTTMPPLDATRAGPDFVFLDTFSDDLDDDEWIRSYPWNPEGPTTNESNGNFNWYLPEQAVVRDGNLELRAERRAFDGKEWVSGLATTCSVQRFGQGHFEARVRLPAGVSLWPAFWLANPDDWPPEVDIFEGVQPDGVAGTFGTNLWSGAAGDTENEWELHELADPGEWHIWGLTWTEDELTWWLDGAIIRRETTRLPDTDLCIIMNLAVGSASSAGTFGVPDERTPDQAVMYVDWIRVDPVAEAPSATSSTAD